MNNTQQKDLAVSMRKIAEILRKQSIETDESKNEKCAHVLIAAHGLSQLQKILNGDHDE